jgi:predicted RNA methylase
MRKARNDKATFIRHVQDNLHAGIRDTKTSIEKIAASYGITDKTQVKEYTELAITLLARSIALSQGSIEERYWRIVRLYESQVTLSHRTSQSVLLQQYSTPAPISFLAGIFVNANENISVFEPSAGNGLLTIAAHPSRVTVNEIDPIRRSNLLDQEYKEVLNQDATLPFVRFEKKFDAVITNPPFGKHERVHYDGMRIHTLDHLMALRALETMKDNGKAAFIIGGHNRYDKKGRFQQGDWRFFFNYLYNRYHVVDLINISGRDLYSRQGTSFNVRLILIDGRKAVPFGAAPLADAGRDEVVDSFDELYVRVMNHVKPRNNTIDMDELEAELRELEALLMAEELGSINEKIIILLNVPYRIVEEYKGFNIVRRAKERDSLIYVHDPTRHSLFAVAHVDTRSTEGSRRFIPETNTIETARAYIDWVTGYSNPDVSELGMPYTPASQSCFVLNTVVPDSMAYETHAALQRIKEAVGGDIDEYVRQRLKYRTKTELCKALSAEQIDAVAMSIYNIEERGQGMIIGDQTGIGKGRIAASMIRYGVVKGVQPVFITEKANLFSDIYRDLVAIGSAHLVPFIVNGRESKTDIKDEDGNIVYQALAPAEQNTIFESGRVPRNFNFVVATYSQFNSPETKPTKPSFLRQIVEDNVVIMDEAHNSSGSGNTGTFMQGAIQTARGVVFLSATFAKRPDNMPLYAMKTSIREANLTDDGLIHAINVGGVAMQEILASQLVAEGQMIRRERSFEGVEVNYVTLDEKEEQHKTISDNITEIIRDIIAFQKNYVDSHIDALDDAAITEGKQIELTDGTVDAGVDNLPYFSKVFNVINQMLFSIKAEAVAERAIARLKEGKKPVIAFSSTMGSFIEQMENAQGMPVSDGDVIAADFSIVLQKGLDGVMRYTEINELGKKVYHTFDISTFSEQGQKEYKRISQRIKNISTGISISPIDIIIEKIEQAGYSVAEVTGRKYCVQFNGRRKKDEDLGIAGQKANYTPGQKVVQISTNKTGVVKYILKRGNFIPGQDNSKSYSFEYEVHFEEGSYDTIEESDLKAFTKVAAKPFTGVVQLRKRENTNDAFRKFNNNEVDVLLINQSGSTGASAHAIATSKVPPEQVKQRVMIVLQAELDISTEVQKRGRINRTGQLHKPIYDYVNSAIPAEKRLMMMLQKKLKSLDANTTSNQKTSTKILDVPDFLNKYGDYVVKEYLRENPKVNAMLDFPMGKGTKDERSIPIDIAHKVSGRVAVLSTEMQQSFYNEITDRYNEQVNYLKQAGEYDLEVEAMDLQAETLSARPVIVGKGGQSAFGEDSVLETVMANVLRKPFTRTELSEALHEALRGQEPEELQRQLLEDYKVFQKDQLDIELREIDAYYRSLLSEAPKAKKLQKILNTAGQAAYQEAVTKRTEELEEARLATEVKIRKLYVLHEQAMELLTKRFYIGRLLKFPIRGWGGEVKVPAVFLGIVVDKKRKNPYAPSALKLRFAIANSARYIAFAASRKEVIDNIISASKDIVQPDRSELLDFWENTIQESTADRMKRYIITGNIVQAFTHFNGKLVSYTTLDGETRKGILLSEYFEPVKQEVVVPLSQAIKVIRSLTVGSSITTNADISIFRTPDHYKIMVAAARKKGGDIYLNADILKIVNKNIFEKVSDKMTAVLALNRIDDLVMILEEKFSDTITLKESQYEMLPKEAHRRTRAPLPKVILDAPVSDDTEISDDLALELELLSLELELEFELLTYNAQ